jgi:protein-tyrosine phosphatase
VAKYLDAGITFFLDLTQEGELEPYDHLLEDNPHPNAGIIHKRMSIMDHDVPEEQMMIDILDTIDQAIAAGHTVYVHCWGGIGRTGTVVGCYLVRHGMTGKQALAQLAQYWKDVEKSWRHPLTVQVEMVSRWGEIEREFQKQ